MSEFTYKVAVNPLQLSASVTFTREELEQAFTDIPGEQPELRFFEIFSPAFEEKTLSERLRLLADVADAIPAPASALGLAASTELREGL